MKPRLMSPRRTALALVLFISALLSIAAQEKTQCNIKVTLLQVNDVYQFAPVDNGKHGGLGRVLTLTKPIRQQNPNTLFMMAGDTISPSVESITHKGAQMIEERDWSRLCDVWESRVRLWTRRVGGKNQGIEVFVDRGECDRHAYGSAVR